MQVESMINIPISLVYVFVHVLMFSWRPLLVAVARIFMHIFCGHEHTQTHTDPVLTCTINVPMTMTMK